MPEIPALVTRALRKSLEQGWVNTTRTETGYLLATLAASRQGVIAECGTGCGVGTAWLKSGADLNTTVLTAELDEVLAASAADVLEPVGITVVHAEFSALAQYGPFSLIYVDVSLAKEPKDLDIAHDLLQTGGMLVIDDFPPASWPCHQRGSDIDLTRQRWLADHRFISTEVMVANDAAVLLCTKR